MIALAWAATAACAAALAWFLGRGRMHRALFLDALALGVALGAAVAVALAPFELRTNPLHVSAATLAFLLAGGPEAAVKMIGVAAFLRGHWRARGPCDVVFAGGVLALGFAGLENFLYLAGAGSDRAALAAQRAVTAAPFHVFEGLTGAYFVCVRPRLAVPAWLGLAAIHGFYDFSVFAGEPGAATPEFWRRLVAASGVDATVWLRGMLAGAQVLAAAAAGAAVAALPPGRESRIAGALGLALAGGAGLALVGGALASLALESAGAGLGVAIYAVAPFALGLLFLRERKPLRPRARRALAGLGAAAALAAALWSATQWRAWEALRFEARGARLAARGDYDAATEAFGRALALAPARVETLTRRAAAQAAARRLDAARADLEAARRLTPGDVALTVALADIDRRRNDPAAAVADLDAALKLKPGDPELLALRARGALEAGDARRAHDDLSEASRIAPDNARVRRVFAAWNVERGDYDAALRDLNARLHADPADAEAAFQRGRVWFYKGDARRAAEDFRRADDGSNGLYPALWRFLAEARLGLDAGAALRPRASDAAWPAPLARMLLGELDSAAARAEARDDGERCEADFYSAAQRLEADPADQSAARFEAALALCPAGFVEREGAKAQLRRLRR